MRIEYPGASEIDATKLHRILWAKSIVIQKVFAYPSYEACAQGLFSTVQQSTHYRALSRTCITQ